MKRTSTAISSAIAGFAVAGGIFVAGGSAFADSAVTTHTPASASANCENTAPANKLGEGRPTGLLAEDPGITAPNGKAAPIVIGELAPDRHDLGLLGAVLNDGVSSVSVRLDRVGNPEPTLITNVNPKLRDYYLAPDVTIQLLDRGYANLIPATLDDLLADVSANSGQALLVDLTFDDNNLVTAISEHYLP